MNMPNLGIVTGSNVDIASISWLAAGHRQVSDLAHPEHMGAEIAGEGGIQNDLVVEHIQVLFIRH
jgi:hypothetical protein